MAEIPSQIGRYRLLEEIGSGGFGRVFRAEHVDLGMVRAVKVATDQEFIRQLRREGIVLARLHHPHIVEVHDSDFSHDPPYIVMEYVEGGDLRKLLERGPVPVERAVQIMLDVLEALEHAHSEGVIHRDIKPSNILLDKNDRAKVSDFGLGRIIEEASMSAAMGRSMLSGSEAASSLISGTLRYMSPEQLEPRLLEGGELDHRSDLYSLGVVFYEMLTGVLPVGLRPLLPSEERPEIPAGFDEVFLKCTTGRRERRYESACAVAEALAAIQQKPEAAGRSREEEEQRSSGPVQAVQKLPVGPQTKGRLVRTLSGHEDAVYSVAFSPDGRLLASGSHDDTIKLWEVETGRLVRTLSGHKEWVWSVTFSPDSRLLVSGARGGTVKLWDVETGRLMRTLSGHTVSVYSVTFSPDSRLLVSGARGGTVKLWEVETGRLVRTLSRNSRSVAFSPDGRLLASGLEGGTVKLWEVETGQLVRTLSRNSRSMAFSLDGKLLALGSSDRTIKLWEVETGRLVRTLSGHKDWVESVAFSPDGRLLASGASDGIVKLWDVETGRLMRTLSGHTVSVYSVTFSPDSRLLVSGARGGTVKLWEVETGRLVRTLSRYKGDTSSVAFSPKGRLLASIGGKTIKLWEVPAL